MLLVFTYIIWNRSLQNSDQPSELRLQMVQLLQLMARFHTFILISNKVFILCRKRNLR